MEIWIQQGTLRARPINVKEFYNSCKATLSAECSLLPVTLSEEVDVMLSHRNIHFFALPLMEINR